GLPSVIVNDTFARHYFGGASVVGRRLRMLWENGTPKEWRTIVGVVPDTFLKGSFNRPRTGAAVFLPLEESVPTYPTVVVRGPRAAKSLADPLRRALARLDPDLVPYGVGTPRTSLIATDGQSAVVTGIFTAFAAVACILATVGLYGVTSFAVGRRTKDLGIRMAMGASRERIITEVLREGGLQFAVGATGGVLLALAFVHFGASRLTDFLYEVSPRDPAVYAAVVALLAAATVVACLVPARRAARVAPMVALRSG
ncbi:MAG TPA: FtsX-like permease family protein, partial [Candidatus Limnocylindria bacterium]|nr:FtsX-like permease family protein [Candidatus Limnocylindria bacterium]